MTDHADFDTLAQRFRDHEGDDRAAMEAQQSRSSALRGLVDACIAILIGAVLVAILGAALAPFRIF